LEHQFIFFRIIFDVVSVYLAFHKQGFPAKGMLKILIRHIKSITAPVLIFIQPFIILPLYSMDVSHDTLAISIPGPWRTIAGDSPEWASPSFDDSDWERIEKPDPREKRGVHWYRTEIILKGKADSTVFLGLAFYNLPTAFEVFWDGRHAGQNGNPGEDRASEKPGSVYKIIALNPAWTQPGRHVLALRVSNTGKSASFLKMTSCSEG
jgi:hypothetical protein